MPIVSIINLISSLISAVITVKLYLRSGTTHNKGVQYFFWCFFFLSIYFFFLAAPQLLSTNPHTIGILNIFPTPFGIIGTVFFVLIPLNLLNWKKLKLFYLTLVPVLALIALTLRILAFQPLSLVTRGDFIFWVRPDDPLVITSWIIYGIIILSSIVLAASTFLYYGYRYSKETYARRRAFLLGIGALLLGIAAGINYVIGSAPSIFALTTASLLAIMGLLTVAFGIFYKKSLD